MKPGPKNSITDVPGILVGHAQDYDLISGVTVVLPQNPVVAAVDCRGGGPGTRETDALRPENLVEHVHAIVLGGGSALGLEAASGAAEWLKEQGRGFPVGPGMVVPIVPAAILFDLNNGGDKSSHGSHSYFFMAQTAAGKAQNEFPLGSVGAGTGASAGTLKGGIGSASLVCSSSTQRLDDSHSAHVEESRGEAKNPEDFTVGALAAVNSFGSVTMPERPEFWAWPFERNNEFGGLPPPGDIQEPLLDFDFESPFRDIENSASQKNREIPANTTLCVVATDAKLNRAQALRVAIMAQDGLARAIRPVHTPFDGDTVFVLSTEERPLSDFPALDVARLGMMSADCVARAVARGVFEAQPLGRWPAYRSHFGLHKS